MENIGPIISKYGVQRHGVEGASKVYWNLPAARIYEHVARNREGLISLDGPLVTMTGRHTGRSPNDRFLVRDATSEHDVWWGKVNRPITPEQYHDLKRQLLAYFSGREIYVFDGHAGADVAHRLSVRVVTEFAWHSLFAQNMFRRESDPEILRNFEPEFTVLSAPGFHADPETSGLASSTFIILNLSERCVLIGGTSYAGEIKKSIFTVMNHRLPEQGVLPMHCSANYGADASEVCLFFGLSGTGKTTLSADPDRTLIGDDEHGWSDQGVFNMEGGCYAKVIRLSPTGEPDIYATTRRFGTILENVVIDPETRRIDLDDSSLTENTRSSYPIDQISNADLDGRGGHPRNVIFLTCDAFGVLPPIAKLDRAQALYHFLSGYTAKVAGTEKGVTEPTATFSTCFGAPFMPRHPSVYAEMLGEKLDKHGVRVWMINTGWTGGPHGIGGRIPLDLTRRLVGAALSGELDEVDSAADSIFGISVPTQITGVPNTILRPRDTWRDPSIYDAKAAELAEMFQNNFRQFADRVGAEVLKAGPVVR